MDKHITNIDRAYHRITTAQQALSTAILDAHQAGTPIAHIAKAAHLSRQSIYRILKDNQQ